MTPPVSSSSDSLVVESVWKRIREAVLEPLSTGETHDSPVSVALASCEQSFQPQVILVCDS